MRKVASLANDNVIALRNNYNGAFVQDDWKAFKERHADLGVRWDYDNQFPNKTNFSPRLGFAWAITPKQFCALTGASSTITSDWAGARHSRVRRSEPRHADVSLLPAAFLRQPEHDHPAVRASHKQGAVCFFDMTDAQIAASGRMQIRPESGGDTFSLAWTT